MSRGGGNIGHALFIEFNEKDSSIIAEVMEVFRQHPEFELLWLKHEPMQSLPGLEIHPAYRKVYCDNQEISLTAKEYDLLCLLVANKGRVLTEYLHKIQHFLHTQISRCLPSLIAGVIFACHIFFSFSFSITGHIIKKKKDLTM